MKKFMFPVMFACLLCSCRSIEEVEATAAAGKANLVGGSYVDPLGVHVSIGAKILAPNKNSSVRAALGYSMQGGNYKDPAYTGTVKTSYITLPLLYTYESDKGFYGEIGLQPALLLSAKDKGKTTFGFEYDDDYKDSVNKIDVGIPVGAGYCFKNGFGIGVRATYGLIKVEKGNTETVHNFVIAAIVRYRFNLGKKK